MISSRQLGYPQQVAILKFIDSGATLPPSTGDPDILRQGDIVYLRDADGKLWSLIDAADPGYVWSPRAATLTNTTLSGEQTIDGQVCEAGDLIWLLNQTTGTENGPWTMASGAWSRPARNLANGQFVLVRQGGNWGGITFQVYNNGPITYGTTTFQTTQINAGLKVGPKSERQGDATLVAGVATVSNISLDSTSVIMLTAKTVGGTAIGRLQAPAADRTNGILTGSFVIRSYKSDGTAETNDTSTVEWLIAS